MPLTTKDVLKLLLKQLVNIARDTALPPEVRIQAVAEARQWGLDRWLPDVTEELDG